MFGILLLRFIGWAALGVGVLFALIALVTVEPAHAIVSLIFWLAVGGIVWAVALSTAAAITKDRNSALISRTAPPVHTERIAGEHTNQVVPTAQLPSSPDTVETPPTPIRQEPTA
jgi:hypothetical protein